MIVRLALPPRFSFDAVVRSHGWYDLPPFDYDREGGVLKTVVAVKRIAPTGRRETENGKRNTKGPNFRSVPVSRFRLSEEAAGEIDFRIRGEELEASSDALDGSRLRAIARRVFSLDLDLADAEQSFAHEPVLARALSVRGGRILRAPSLFEDAVKILFTTNCSWGATRGMVSRLIAFAGADGRAFPTPESVGRFSTATIEKRARCGYRAEALSLFARRVASGKLDLSRWEDRERPSEELRGTIVKERGFGPYAAEMLLRILGRHDFYALDSWTRQQYRRMYPGRPDSTDRAIARRYRRFGAHRGLALWLDMTRGWHGTDPPTWPEGSEQADSR